ncbi:MAG: hypothetical protein IJV05_11600 [Muribaculaceae bacterium]|nr:hypothetical protein [Muribaculaceae bacterium]
MADSLMWGGLLFLVVEGFEGGIYEPLDAFRVMSPGVSGPLRGPVAACSCHHATSTFGTCAVVLLQVKAAGLVEAFDLLRRT